MTEWEDRRRKAIQGGGDLGERKALEWADSTGVTLIRFGFDHIENPIPSHAFGRIPPMIRSAPDFIAVPESSFKAAFWLEAKTFNGGQFQFKLRDFGNYRLWQESTSMGFYLYLFDIYLQEHKCVHLDSFKAEIEKGTVEIRRMDGYKKCFLFESDWLTDASVV